MRLARRLADAGLGLRVGAVLQLMAAVALALGPRAARAQVPDTLTRRDTVAVPARPPGDPVVDSLQRAAEAAARDTVRADTLKAPLARFPAPPTSITGGDLRWDREALFATGALTLLDLLERVPGLTGLRSGWITTPMVGAYHGDPGGVRLFLDGVELDPLDVRGGGVTDLSRIPLWTLEEVAVEPGAEQLRVYLTSWRVGSTVPTTRTDVFTGDDDTNVYRGFFGRRFGRGEALQVGAQQYSTSGQRLGGDGDGLDIMGRVGYARGGWSADAFIQRTRRTHDERQRAERGQVTAETPLAPYESRHTEAYLRAGYGSPASGLWLQLVAASLAFAESSPRLAAGAPGVPPDTVDSAASRSQYVAAGGYTRGGLRLAATHRLRAFGGGRYHSPAVRASYERPRISVSLLGEAGALDETLLRDQLTAPLTDDAPRVSRASIVARVEPLSFLALTGAAGQSRWSRGGESGLNVPEATRTVRGEAAVRLARLWVGGGMVRTDSAAVPPPVVFDPAYRLTTGGGRVPVPATTAGFVTVRGTLYRAIGADAWAMRWADDSLPYRPQFQTRATVYLQTRWLRRFPSGSFGLYLGATHEYRSETYFPTANGLTSGTQMRALSTLLEIRILDGVLSWQQRNNLGAIYEQVPGFEAPRQTNLYGIRWEFFN